MQMTTFILLALSLATLSCAKPTEESVTDVNNGSYKIVVRSQEFHHSAIRNVDICVTNVTSNEFPAANEQCFLHGFDFSGLAARWTSDRNVEISFACGRISRFSNFAVLSQGHAQPVEFHATLNDGCNRALNFPSFPQ
jgi:hypothetical protein